MSTTSYNLLCYSQGGIICRTFLQLYANRVHTFFTISAPLNGQYGATNFDKFFPGISTENAYLLFYTKVMQQHVSIANYWRDPFHRNMYEEQNLLLPFLNGDLAWHESFTRNFANVQQVIMIAGPNDGVITPWQSALFANYVWNTTQQLQTMEQQPFYDLLGLRRLQNSGKLLQFIVPNITHLQWPKSELVFTKYILPYLI